MTDKLEQIKPRLYKRVHRAADGAKSVRYYARFVCWDDKRRMWGMGADLDAGKADLKLLEACDAARKDFDGEDWWKEREKDWRGELKNRGKAAREAADGAKPNNGKSKPFTFSEWAKLYPSQPSAKFKTNGKPKRSLDATEVPIIK